MTVSKEQLRCPATNQMPCGSEQACLEFQCLQELGAISLPTETSVGKIRGRGELADIRVIGRVIGAQQCLTIALLHLNKVALNQRIMRTEKVRASAKALAEDLVALQDRVFDD